MSMLHCENCNVSVDTDMDVEHFDICGKEVKGPVKKKGIRDRVVKWLASRVTVDWIGQQFQRRSGVTDMAGGWYGQSIFTMDEVEEIIKAYAKRYEDDGEYYERGVVLGLLKRFKK